MTEIHSLVNQKGGVGKTTSAINLGAYLALRDKKVLLVDLDPQSNATACLGIDKNSVEHGTYEALVGTAPAEDSVLHNPKLKLSILPATQALAGGQIEMVNMKDREHRLSAALDPIADRYDFILIDCPPSLGILTLNGLVASKSGVIIPVQCEYLALEGLSQLMNTLQRVRQGLFPELEVSGLIMTMFDGRTNLSQEVVDEVHRHFPGQVYNSLIPRSVRLAEAPSYGLPISAYAPRSPGAKAYEALAKEFLQTSNG